MLIVLKLIMLAVMIAGPVVIGRELALAARGKERAAAPAAKAESAAEDAA